MGDNPGVIRELYEALDRHDGETMARQYAPDARFEDRAFGELSGTEAAHGMWRMLTGRTGVLKRSSSPSTLPRAIPGTAHWIATYTFSTVGPSSTTSMPGFAFETG